MRPLSAVVITLSCLCLGSAFAAASPDGKFVASCGADGSVRLWELKTGKQVREFEGHTDVVHAVAFSPDGRRLLTGGYDRTARVWDVGSGKELQRFENHAGIVTCAAFLPGGRQAVTSSYDKTLRLWRVKK
jgi:WD40 repeat protein